MSNGLLGTNRLIAVLADGTTFTMVDLHNPLEDAHRYLSNEADFFADRENNKHPRTVALIVVDLATGKTCPVQHKYLDANLRIEASRR
jgi:hypothetical protein